MSAEDELLDDVISRYAASPNARLKEVTVAAIKHLHAFVREVDLQRDEWMAGIKFLTETGQWCSETRQEWILLSDTLGVSMLVEMLNHAASSGTTDNTVLGPFHAPGSPERAFGESMLEDPDDGDRVVIRGRVSGLDKKPIEGAVLDCWQNATHGFYAVQQPDKQSIDNLRGIYRTKADGKFEIRTVRPVPYPVPFDGTVGDLLRNNARGWMRPGHTHVWVRAPGYKELITHLFDADTKFLDEDPVFGVRKSLVTAFKPDESGELSTTFDFVLDPV